MITDVRFFFPFAATALSPRQEAPRPLGNTEFLAKMKSLEENVTYLHQTLVRDLVVRYKGQVCIEKKCIISGRDNASTSLDNCFFMVEISPYQLV